MMSSFTDISDVQAQINLESTYLNRKNSLVGLVVLSAAATLEVLGSFPRSSKNCYWVFYETLSSSSELGFVPG